MPPASLYASRGSYWAAQQRSPIPAPQSRERTCLTGLPGANCAIYGFGLCRWKQQGGAMPPKMHRGRAGAGGHDMVPLLGPRVLRRRIHETKAGNKEQLG